MTRKKNQKTTSVLRLYITSVLIFEINFELLKLKKLLVRSKRSHTCAITAHSDELKAYILKRKRAFNNEIQLNSKLIRSKWRYNCNSKIIRTSNI